MLNVVDNCHMLALSDHSIIRQHKFSVIFTSKMLQLNPTRHLHYVLKQIIRLLKPLSNSAN